MIEQEQGASRQVKNNQVRTLAFVTFLIIVSGMGLNNTRRRNKIYFN